MDGLLTFGLGPGEHLAAPGFHTLQHLPALLFTTLLRGATFLHLEPADLEASPALLTEHPVRALGVTPALREALSRSRLPLKNVGHWFRNPEGPFDWQAWRDWVKQCGLASVPCSNVLVDAAAGGAVLCSPRRVGDVHIEAAPAPGRSWALQDLNQSGQEAAGDTGLFTLLPAEDRPLSHIILTRSRNQYQYGGTRDARREGRVYPALEVTEALREEPGPALTTSVLPVPAGGLAASTATSCSSSPEASHRARRHPFQSYAGASSCSWAPSSCPTASSSSRSTLGSWRDNWTRRGATRST